MNDTSMPTITYPVLENGEWVTERIDLHGMPVGQQEDLAHPTDATDSLPATPTLGLLSKTVIRSPTINNILPARLRSVENNDIVFVGEDFIHIKEVFSNGDIEHVATKSDFGGKILASRVLGQVNHEKLDTRDQLGHDQRSNISEDKFDRSESYDPMEIDEAQHSLPPQLLVLTLDIQQLVFVILRQASNGSYEFRQMIIPLPTSLDYLETLGKHLAVDSRSKAMAVGAWEGSFAIYQIKNLGQLREDAKEGVRDWCPIQAQQILKINGVILKMEFLEAGSADDNRVVLILVVARKGRILIHTYVWDFSDGLEQRPVDTRVEKIGDSEYQSPLLLIPIRNRRDYVLMCEHGSFVCTNVLSRHSSKDAFEVFHDAPNHPGSSKNLPLWTGWARPQRHYHGLLEEDKDIGYKGDGSDFIYLLREDGVVAYLVFSGKDRHTIKFSNAANFKGRFNTAFSVIPLKYVDPDLLIIAGNGSDGCVRKIGGFRLQEGSIHPKGLAEHFKGDLLSSISNWSPTIDILGCDVGFVQVSGARSHSGFFIASSKQPYGMIAQLHSGIESSPLGCLTIDTDTGVADVPIDIWPLPDPTNNRLIILSSYPTHTRIFYVEPDDEITDEVKDKTWQITDNTSSYVDINKRTIWAGCLFSKFSVHVTQDNVRIFEFSHDSDSLYEIDVPIVPSGQTILAATLDTQLRTLAVISYGEQCCLEIWTFFDDIFTCKKAEGFLEIATEPTCITTHDAHDGLIIAVATTAGTLILSKWTAYEGFSIPYTYHLSDIKHGSSREPDFGVASGFDSSSVGTVCESIVLLSANCHTAHWPTFYLLCGLRDGTLCSIPFSQSGDFYDQKSGQAACASIGPTAVKLQPLDGHSGLTVVAHNETNLCRVSIDLDDSSRLHVNSILLKDDVKVHWRLGSIAACTSIPEMGYPTRPEFYGAVVCFSDNNCGILRVGNSNATIPRRFNLQSSPERMIFCDWLRLFVVAGTKTTSKEVRASGSPKQAPNMRRIVRGVIEFIRPSASSSSTSPTDTSDLRTIKAEGQHCGSFELFRGERIFALSQWTHRKDQGTKHGLVLIGTGPSDHKSPREGRLLFIEATTDPSGKIQCKIKKQVSQSSAVRCVAVFQSSYFVCGVGKVLRMYAYDGREKRLWRIGETELSSDAIHITTESSFVHVSTLEDSICAFYVELEDNTPRFIPVALDRLSRTGATHLPLQIRLPGIRQIENSQDPQAQRVSPKYMENKKDDSISLILASDQANDLVGLHRRYALRKPVNGHSPELQQELLRPSSNTAPILFTANLPRTMTRLQQITNLRAPWRPRSADLPGVLENNIIGSAADGTLMNFTLVSEASLNLLRFLCDLYYNFKRKCARTEIGTTWDEDTLSEMEQRARNRMRKAAAMGLAVGAQREQDKFKRDHHIDGDFLTRMIGGETELLREIVMGSVGENPQHIKKEADAMRESDESAGESADETMLASSYSLSDLSHRRRYRFGDRPDRRIGELAELMKRLIQEEGGHNLHRWEGDLITVTTRYVKDVLEPIF